MVADYLIVGQGISGTWLSYYLKKANKSFIIIDDNKENAASRVAAGIINPVTGRRIVKTWMIDELLSFIAPAYRAFGSELGISAITKTNLIDFHPTSQMKIAFDERVSEQADFLFKDENGEELYEVFNFNFGYGIVDPCYIVNLNELLTKWRMKLLDAGQVVTENFDIGLLSHQENQIRYKEIIADKIIFCDGIDSSDNKYFKNLPFALNKGEALIIESGELPESQIFKHGMMLAPLGKNNFWIGSNYLWEFDNDLPSKQFREQAEQLLNTWLKVPYKIIDHLAGIRPANIERRPFVGFHPIYKNIGLLNGMGTKGCSLAPFFAKQFVDNLTEGMAILADADINRFSKILQR